MAEQAGKAIAVEMDQDELISFEPELMTEQDEAFDPDQALALSDLLQDANGEVVLFNDSSVPVLTLHAGAGVVEEGQSGPHVTAAGEDVSGFRYVSFDNGLTLYYQGGLDLIVRSEQG
jgi:hypothetical protein